MRQIVISHLYDLNEEVSRDWKHHGTEIIRKKYNEQLIIGDHPFYFISPIKDRFDENENSLVVFTMLGGKSWLFTGDIGKETEQDLIKNYKNLSVDVLKVGHHGSNTSTDPLFISHINPSYALISAGINNSYGHPTKEVLETLEKEGVFVLRTDKNGAIQYRFKKNTGTFFKHLP